MEAKLKRLHSPDVFNLEDYQSDVQDEFGFLLQAMIGPAGEEGEESFDIEVWINGDRPRFSVSHFNDLK